MDELVAFGERTFRLPFIRVRCHRWSFALQMKSTVAFSLRLPYWMSLIENPWYRVTVWAIEAAEANGWILQEWRWSEWAGGGAHQLDLVRADFERITPIRLMKVGINPGRTIRLRVGPFTDPYCSTWEGRTTKMTLMIVWVIVTGWNVHSQTWVCLSTRFEEGEPVWHDDL